MRTKLAAVTLLSAIITGCASPGAIVPMPAVPAPVTDSVRFTVFTQNNLQLQDNVVQSRAALIPVGSSVVISVPAKKSDESGQSDFSTDGFFNTAEQQIERSLLRNGFQVKDRAKFEAILRDLRDTRGNDRGFYGRYGFDERDFDPAMRPLLQRLTEQLEKREITETEFYTQLDELRSRSRISSQTRNRGENERELSDISEVIRAASASDIQADYVLQINQFNPIRPREERVNLFNFLPVREFMAQHGQLKEQFEQRQFYSCETLEATLNAKLINVKSGDVVWIGNHAASELDGAESSMELEFTYRRAVANANEVANFVNQQNLPYVREMRGDFVKVPAWQFRDELLGPTLISGANCRIAERGNDEIANIRTILSRRVASELISTIKVGDM